MREHPAGWLLAASIAKLHDFLHSKFATVEVLGVQLCETARAEYNLASICYRRLFAVLGFATHSSCMGRGDRGAKQQPCCTCADKTFKRCKGWGTGDICMQQMRSSGAVLTQVKQRPCPGPIWACAAQAAM